MRGAFLKKNDTLITASPEADQLLQSIKDGKECIVSIDTPRNAKQLRMFWALCDILADNCKEMHGKEQAKKALLWSLNYIEPFMDMGSKRIRFETKSIAIESMPQDEFNEFFQSAIQLVCEWLGSAPSEVRKRVAEITDPARGHQWRD